MKTKTEQGIDFEALLCVKPFTANILSPEAASPAWGEIDGIIPADKRLQYLCQNIIDCFDEHKHLRKARILLLIKHSDADAKKLEDGKKLSVGKATKASHKLKALMASLCGPAPIQKKKYKTLTADFVITLSGDYLEAAGALCNGEKLEDCEGVRKMAALMDHELSHCSAVIAGKSVSEEGVAMEIEGLGDAFLDQGQPDGGMVFIRYYKLKNEKFQWKIRKHDLEEFVGVVRRHGPWAKDLRDLVDVIEEWTPEQRKLFE